MKMESKTQRYYREHKRCPACRNETLRQSYVGFIEDGDDIFKPYKDTNKASCKCGWEGIVHDLVGEQHGN